MIDSLWDFRARRALSSLAITHQLALEALVQLLAAQDGGCAICARSLVFEAQARPVDGPQDEIEWHRPKVARATAPLVDYCPETGVVRGLVCVACRKILADTTDPYELFRKRIVIIAREKWINPKPNRPHRRRKRKTHTARKDMLHSRLIPRERRLRVLDYFARDLDESLVSACWKA